MQDQAGSSLRERTRAARVEAVVSTARWLVSQDGEDALTMQRLADELECAVGSLYRYFPAKSDLLAAVRAEQLRCLDAWLRAAEPTGDGAADPLGTLVHRGRRWIEGTVALRAEVALARRLAAARYAPGGDPGGDGLEPLVGWFADPLHAAVAARALRPGDARVRAQVLVCSLTDVALMAATADSATSGADATPIELLGCLLATWGAGDRALADGGQRIGDRA